MDQPTIRAIYNGMQQGAAGREPFELWMILEAMEGHPQYSTLSRRTIEAQGKVIVDATPPSKGVHHAIHTP